MLARLVRREVDVLAFASVALSSALCLFGC